MVLEGWQESSFTFDGSTYPTYRRGTGPGVIVVHEIPGITPRVEAFANEVDRVPVDHDVVVVARPEARELAEREGLAGVQRELAELVGRAVVESGAP